MSGDFVLDDSKRIWDGWDNFLTFGARKRKNKMNDNLISYYKDRVNEYENIYAKPERQEDLKSAEIILKDIFDYKNVIEIACGTGYWTERIAPNVDSIFATDINESAIEVAKRKFVSNSNISFGLADIYDLPTDKKYESLFGGFIWSHIKLQDLDKFLSSVNQLVSPGGTVVFMDNNFVEGSNHPITKTDENGNTFQKRKLEDSTTHLVLKNFPTEEFLFNKLKYIARNIKIINLKYYWILSYNTLDDE